ncbi:hypothetical protein CHS0354_023356 [Potamilus streckersoni]|uniref:Uncharacterized protein n=1 Tax=Potamilus streckersoni TaxID=2493646 RepID=A0AAE0T4M9_9BIVA|nr:hypothetical protein CHS0354_023356 [Potamilus streckersoni]
MIRSQHMNLRRNTATPSFRQGKLPRGLEWFTLTMHTYTMLWSGSYVISHEYAEASRRYFTLEDILIGYVVNNLTWCGQKKAPGIDYDMCPQTCGMEADATFWGKASSSVNLFLSPFNVHYNV